MRVCVKGSVCVGGGSVCVCVCVCVKGRKEGKRLISMFCEEGGKEEKKEGRKEGRKE